MVDRLFKRLADDGAVEPVVEACYPLEQTAAALKYLETGRGRGKLVIQVA